MLDFSSIIDRISYKKQPLWRGAVTVLKSLALARLKCTYDYLTY